ncbi:MAG TPA: alpha/beta hydrolase-fold protein [Vicinamibacterales bacterium]|nr:alpha/beta hydrolase-fold protein [Vicinamibacterales bacterium]
MIKRTLKHVLSPQLHNRRDVDVYLPASYASGVRYPVVYLQDGQNLSDPATAFAGTWELDAAIDRLAWSGLEAIFVGIHNAGRDRLSEYSPFPDARHGGGEADAYLAFVVHTLKPRIDRMFHSRRDRDNTVIFGSSMGGLVSLYAYFRYPSVFGRAGVMSPSIWFGRGAILQFIEEARVPGGRIYLDVGTGEGAGTLRDVRRLGRLLVRQGFRRRRSSSSSALRYVEDPGARHTEGAWAWRLQGALEVLLSS